MTPKLKQLNSLVAGLFKKIGQRELYNNINQSQSNTPIDLQSKIYVETFLCLIQQQKTQQNIKCFNQLID